MNVLQMINDLDRVSERCLFEAKAKRTRHQPARQPAHATPCYQEKDELTALSYHALLRAKQRGLRCQDIGFVMQHGVCYHAAGAKIYYLRRIDIPSTELRTKARLEGTAVITATNGQRIITVWRNRLHGSRNLHHKLGQIWHTGLYKEIHDEPIQNLEFAKTASFQ